MCLFKSRRMSAGGACTDAPHVRSMGNVPVESFSRSAKPNSDFFLLTQTEARHQIRNANLRKTISLNRYAQLIPLSSELIQFALLGRLPLPMHLRCHEIKSHALFARQAVILGVVLADTPSTPSHSSQPWRASILHESPPSQNPRRKKSPGPWPKACSRLA